MRLKNYALRSLSLVAPLLLFAPEILAGEGHVRHMPSAIKDEYIVVFNDDTPIPAVVDTAKAVGRQYQGDVQKVWQYALKGMFIKMPAGRAEAMSHDPRIRFVEENAETFFSATQNTKLRPSCTGNCATSDNREWHLDRLDDDPIDGQYKYCSTGSGIYVFVVDTGVNASHSEISGATIHTGWNSAGDDNSRYPATNTCNGFTPVPASMTDNDEYARWKNEVFVSGHGTSVASLVVGPSTGAAKNAIIVPVKVKRCDFYTARRRVNGQTYHLDDLILDPTNGKTWKCMVTVGVANGSDPGGWTTQLNATVNDGTVTWKNIGDPDNPTKMSTTQMLIDGTNWIVDPTNNPDYSHVNHSIATYSVFFPRGATAPSALDNAVMNLIDKGVTVFASANNQGDDACNTSPGLLSRNNPDPNIPATNRKVITVGGSMLVNDPDYLYYQGDGGSPGQTQPSPSGLTQDARWICGAGDSDLCQVPGDPSGSNYGPCVTLFAPAKNITSARLTGTADYRPRLGFPTPIGVQPGPDLAVASGTSFSAPIAAGVAARFLENKADATPDDVYNALMNSARRNVMLDNSTYPLNGSPNVFLRATNAWIYNITPSQTIAANTPFTMSVSAAPSTVSYQWYQGAAGDVSHPLQTAATQQVTISQTTSYWARVSCVCDNATTSVDSPAVTLTVSAPSPPTGLSATTNSDGISVTIRWNLVTGATGYQVKRAASWAGPFTNIGGIVTGTTQSDGGMATATPTTYVYQVVALNGSTASNPSNNDYATVATTLFHDATIVAGQTAIKAQHITDLRAAVDSVRVALGTTPANWQEPLTLITANSFNEVRNRLNDARTLPAVNLGNYPYSSSVVANGTILKTHMDEMREAVK